MGWPRRTETEWLPQRVRCALGPPNSAAPKIEKSAAPAECFRKVLGDASVQPSIRDGVGRCQQQSVGEAEANARKRGKGGQNTHVEEVVASHAWLTGNAGGDDNNVGVLERLAEASVGRQIASHGGRGVDVREIGGNTRSVDAVDGSKRQNGPRQYITRNICQMGFNVAPTSSRVPCG